MVKRPLPNLGGGSLEGGRWLAPAGDGQRGINNRVFAKPKVPEHLPDCSRNDPGRAASRNKLELRGWGRPIAVGGPNFTGRGKGVTRKPKVPGGDWGGRKKLT